jgi:hypothetical protein
MIGSVISSVAFGSPAQPQKVKTHGFPVKIFPNKTNPMKIAFSWWVYNSNFTMVFVGDITVIYRTTSWGL